MAKGARVATLDSLHQQFKEGELKDLNLIIKADVGGTAEVLSDTLQQLSTDKVRVRVLRAGVGAITEDDVLLASASEAHDHRLQVQAGTKCASTSRAAEGRHSAPQHHLRADRRSASCAMTGLLDPVYQGDHPRATPKFARPSRSARSEPWPVATSPMASIRRDSQIRVLRDGDVIHTGKIEALKRFKNDASEVKNGLECGISLVKFQQHASR